MQPTLGDYRVVNKPRESSKSGQREHSKITARTSREEYCSQRGGVQNPPFKGFSPLQTSEHQRPFVPEPQCSPQRHLACAHGGSAWYPQASKRSLGFFENTLLTGFTVFLGKAYLTAGGRSTSQRLPHLHSALNSSWSSGGPPGLSGRMIRRL